MFDLTNSLIIAFWLLSGIGLGTFVGFFLGRIFTLKNESKKLAKEKASIFRSLSELIHSAEEITESVDRNNQSLANVEQDLKEIRPVVDFANLQSRFLGLIDKIVQNNQQMETDLAATKYRLESQAQELDRSRKEARTDMLCDVGNRKAFEEAIEFMQTQFNSRKISFALMLVDLDHFKSINDTHGHQAGDEVLISVGQTLKECVRPNDIVTRIGGDEFAMLLRNVNVENAESLIHRIRETIESHNFRIGEGESSTVVTTSMGVAIVQPDEEASTLYKRADQALYKSKELGRNCLTIASPSMAPPAEKQSRPSAQEINLSSILPTDTLPGFDHASPSKSQADSGLTDSG